MSWLIHTGDANMREPLTRTAQRKDERLGVLGAVAFVEQAIETITIFGSVV
jgi:hypothetical protein